MSIAAAKLAGFARWKLRLANRRRVFAATTGLQKLQKGHQDQRLR